MSASLEKSADSPIVSWTAHPAAGSVFVELKDVDDGMEWILMSRSAASSASLRGVANNQVEIRGLRKHALTAHTFEVAVHRCYPGASHGTLSSYLVAQSHQATCTTGGPIGDLEQRFTSQLRLASSTTASSGKYTQCLI